ncbi:hypothetical protein VOLCADRAFT_105076 [Volvox carteri f. nagariensis]|uniref:Uncharacterized protein n=1 Tax=Volvox carteri f. nagariensis TaxID=3068 RepID=D8TY93_VOLCA|nr:uncharacterized protein VOLCADRAFT_105076 [Volvox carteri f. nagariensis]EFJ47604.1 hypothetical protein VOLCADRAFT_105076 [Volvox carteri f. nagariensis]|eukprot:XP_002951428.1 hypothetical protein VOLCADRAFT_105076 [Volvox carteri f. nagariensis]
MGPKKRASEGAASCASSKKQAFSKILGTAFETRYAGWLAKGLDGDAILLKTRKLKLPYDEVIDIIFPKVFKDVLIASACVIQPPSQERPKYIIFWELLKNLLSFQGLDKLFGVFVGGDDEASEDANVGDEEDDTEDDTEDDEEDDEEDHEEDDVEDGEHDFLLHAGFEESLEGLLAQGKSKFVLVHSHPDKVKAAVDVEKQLWQPLATALELAEASGTEEPVWVLLTDMQTWYFAKVQRAGPRPQTNEQGAAAAAVAQAPTLVVPQDPPASLMRAKASLYVYSIQLYEHIYAGLKTYSSDYYQVLEQLLKIMYPGLDLRELPTRQDAGQEVINSQTESWVKESLANAKSVLVLYCHTVDCVTRVQQENANAKDLVAEYVKQVVAAEDLAAKRVVVAEDLAVKRVMVAAAENVKLAASASVEKTALMQVCRTSGGLAVANTGAAGPQDSADDARQWATWRWQCRLATTRVKRLSATCLASQISERYLANARGGASVIVVCMLRPGTSEETFCRCSKAENAHAARHAARACKEGKVRAGHANPALTAKIARLRTWALLPPPSPPPPGIDGDADGPGISIPSSLPAADITTEQHRNRVDKAPRGPPPPPPQPPPLLHPASTGVSAAVAAAASGPTAAAAAALPLEVVVVAVSASPWFHDVQANHSSCSETPLAPYGSQLGD